MPPDDSLGELLGDVFDQYLPWPGQKPSVRIGTNALSGEKLYLPIEQMAETHTYVPGSSGVGKSKFLEQIARGIIDKGYGLMVLDGKGDLFDDLFDYCTLMDLADKTILLDPNDLTHTIGINYLEPLGQTTPEALTTCVMDGLKKLMQEEKERKPWLDEWGPVAILPLILSKFTMLELFHFLNPEKPEFRDELLGKIGEGFYKDKWETLKSFRPFDQALILNSLRTRATYFWSYQALKLIFGQEKTTVDWLKMMNEGGIFLAKLGRTPRLSEIEASLIGTAILHQITTIAPERPQGKRRPFFVIMDEFQKFLTSDVADAMDRMRGYGISFIVAHQHRGQLEREAPEILASIDTNCLNKITFAVSRKDAEKMAEDIFTGYISGDKIKDEIRQTKFRPVKTRETVVTYSESESESYSSSSTTGTSQPETGFGEESGTTTTSESSTSSDQHGRSSTRSTANVPWYDYQEFQEVSSRTFYSLEEVKERYIGWVKNQSNRHAQWKFMERKPIPIVTPFIKKAIVTEKERQAFRRKIYENYKSFETINREINERVAKYLGQERKGEIPVRQGKPPGPASYRRKKTQTKEK